MSTEVHKKITDVQQDVNRTASGAFHALNNLEKFQPGLRESCGGRREAIKDALPSTLLQGLLRSVAAPAV